jgi:predicted branched-subunit amino acid permease
MAQWAGSGEPSAEGTGRQQAASGLAADDPKQADAGTGRRTATPVRDGVGLGLAVGVSGLAFGAAAVGAGLSAWQACALSALAFTGASQFALIGAVAVGGNLLAATAGAILLGGRNTLYGLRLAGLLRLRGVRRLLGAQGVIDETTAVTLAQPDAESSRVSFVTTFACLYLTWNLSTLAGAFGAGTLASPRALGLDVVGPAAFLALIWPRLRAGRTERAVAGLGAAIALGLTPVLPTGVPVILAATAALAGALATTRPTAAPTEPGGPAGAGGTAGSHGTAGAGSHGTAGRAGPTGRTGPAQAAQS